MLSKERALYWYQRIVDNEKSGNYEQKVLGLRRIFNSVLLEMFPNISEQSFYCACIDQIFEVKKIRGEFRPTFNKNQREFHQLRLYFNNLMHSKIEADEKGYMTATRRLSSLIKFCSEHDVPETVSMIYSKNDDKLLKPKLIDCKTEPKRVISSSSGHSQVLTESPILCIIVDRRNDLLNIQLQEIENGIKFITKNAIKGHFNLVIFTIKKDASILAFPISGKKTRFSFNGSSEDEQIKPLRDYLVNLNPQIQYHFFLTKAYAEFNFNIPVSLNESSFLMTIGIVDKNSDKGLSDTRVSSSFDKLILDSNLPSFFDWIVKIINNS